MAPAYYPLIYIPRLLAHAHEAVPFPPRPPVAVATPIAPSPPLIFKLDPSVKWVVSAWVFIGGAGAFVDAGAGVLGLLLGLAGAMAWAQSRRYYRLRYEQRQQDYQRDCADHAVYRTRHADYERQLQVYANADHLSHYRTERLAALLAATPLQPQLIPSADYTPPRGRSEAAFLAHLRHHFGSANILVDCRVPIEDAGVSRSRSDAWYYPDFVYRDASGLCLDIEVDEPYVWTTGEPHHCQGQDDARNAFFLRKQWGVIRFTEEQVMREPLLCCQVVAAEIYALTGLHYGARFYYKRLAPVAQWDESTARRLAARRSRQLY